MSTTPWLAPPIDWTIPAGPTDWLLGTGATRLERVVVWSCAAAGTAAAAGVALHFGVAWRWWQWLLVLLVALDLLGGAPANALSTAKRLYHSAPPPGAHPLNRLVRHPFGFSALHLHPFVLAALLPGGTWVWGLAWYLGGLAGTAFVVLAPAYVRRAVAFAVVALLLVLAPLVAPPDGLQWFGPVLVVKLVLAHAVREEPYRPGPWTTTEQTPTPQPNPSGR